ncbi:MAG TPA: tetratricopeptide repeat protein [Terriglobia bacterium]|nr:tetratricopeptide repeat protein [Terriglobia bacterium]
MKKETLITIVVFLGVGFLGGYAYNAHQNSVLRQKLALSSSGQQSTTVQPGDSSTASAPASDVGLPQGHPPVDAREIIQFFESAAAQNPSDPAPRLKLANFLYDRQRWAEAIPWYRQALQLSPRNVDAMTDMATCSFNLGQFAQAINELDEGLKIDPQHQPTLFNLIVVNLEGAHNVAAARRAWKRLNAMNPAYPHLAELKQRLDAELASAGKPVLK